MSEFLPKVPDSEKSFEDRLDDLQLLVVEMEGVLSDGRVRTDADGQESIITCQRDALGLRNWMAEGNKAVVIARQGLEAAARWCAARDLPFLAHQQAGKNSLLTAIIFEHGLAPKNVCYMGSDIDDLPPMMVAGVAVCPSDADPWVKGGSHLALNSPAGGGAVRELVDMLLQRRQPRAVQGK